MSIYKRIKSDVEQDDSDCTHDSPVRRKSSDAVCYASSSVSTDCSSDTDESVLIIHVTIDLMLLVLHKAVDVSTSLRMLTVCVKVGHVKSTIMLTL